MGSPLKFYLTITALITAGFLSCTPSSTVTDRDSDHKPLDNYYSIQPDAPDPNHSGMWLLPQIEGPIYQQMLYRGLNLGPEDFYHPDRPSLNQSVVRINIGDDGGGTGSFVSGNGLILTNHHVAYDGISSLSTTENNYLVEGFASDGVQNEAPLPRFSLYIPVEQIEVTGQINKGITEEMNRQAAEVRKQEIRQQLISKRQDGIEDLIVEINDFWEGNRQFMTSYRVISDVRLVHAPPESIGKYGGDIDNWQWPRHTGDFTFLRAYVAPDGSSRLYHKENVPFQPGHFLPIHAGNLQLGDITLVLGFPGSTYRFESSHAFEFYENIQIPSQIKAFKTQLSGLELEAENSKKRALENASDRASLANALKYFNSVLDGFNAYDITEKKESEDRKFHQWVKEDSLRNQKYGRVLPQLAQSYHIAGQMGELLFTSFYTLQFNRLIQLTTLFDDYYEYLSAPDNLDFSAEDRQNLYRAYKNGYSGLDLEAELLKLEKSLNQFSSLRESERPLFVYSFFHSDIASDMNQQIRSFLNRQKKNALLLDTLNVRQFIFDEQPRPTEVRKDSLYLLSEEIRNAFEISRDTYVQHFQYLEPAQKRYAEGKMEMDPDSHHYSDANFTLRVSAGEVRGYRPEDGLYATPFTYYDGMLNKHTGEDPFKVPDNLFHYTNSVSFENFPWFGFADQAGNLTLNFLTTNDITGGNSGSPVLNASGELIGVAFDSNIEGVAGDYYFLPELNRTISVDVRYILFLLHQSGNASHILNELKIRR